MNERENERKGRYVGACPPKVTKSWDTQRKETKQEELFSCGSDDSTKRIRSHRWEIRGFADDFFSPALSGLLRHHMAYGYPTRLSFPPIRLSLDSQVKRVCT